MSDAALTFLEAALSEMKENMPPIILPFSDAGIDDVERTLTGAGLSSTVVDLDAIAARNPFCADAMAELTARDKGADVLVLVATSSPSPLPGRLFSITCRNMLLARVVQLAEAERAMVLLTDAETLTGTPDLGDRFIHHL